MWFVSKWINTQANDGWHSLKKILLSDFNPKEGLLLT